MNRKPNEATQTRSANGGGFGGRVKELRLQRKLSQAELAELAGLHQIHVGRYERGTSRPSADTLKKLADALGVTGDYLLSGSTADRANENMEDRELLRMFQELSGLAPEDKNVVIKLIDAFLTKKKLGELSAEPSLSR